MNEKNEKKHEKRQALFKKQNGICHWCRKPMTLINYKKSGIPNNFATFEHLKRQREGGFEAEVLACSKCNNGREHGIDTNSMPHVIDLWANFLAHEKLHPAHLEEKWAGELVRLCEALAKKTRPKFRPYRARLLTRQIICETAMDLGIDLLAIKTKYNHKIIIGRGLLDIWNRVYEQRFGSTFGTQGEYEAKRRDLR